MPAVTIDELTLADEPEHWARLGFVVSGDCLQLGRVRIRLAGAGSGRGIIGWSLREIASDALDGLATTISARPLPESVPPHPNGVVAIDHVVVMSPALQRSIEALEAAGLRLRRLREEPTPAGAPRQAFFRLGGEILEVVQEPDEVLARAGGPDHPARFWGLALAVEDLQQAAERLGSHAGEIRPAVQRGRQILTLRRSAGLAAPVALMSTAEDRVRAG